MGRSIAASIKDVADGNEVVFNHPQKMRQKDQARNSSHQPRPRSAKRLARGRDHNRDH